VSGELQRGRPALAAPAGAALVPRAAAVRVGHRILRLAERSAPRNLPPSRAAVT
jgi:hypothetical protein